MSVSSPKPSALVDPALSPEELIALREACAPAGMLKYPTPEIIHTLRRHGYIEIVIGGVQATQSGLERLLREREQKVARKQP